MGTRHSIIVILNGETKVAQYGQWDGDPGGQGSDIYKFLKEVMDSHPAVLHDPKIVEEYGPAPTTPDSFTQFKEAVAQLTPVTQEKWDEYLLKYGNDNFFTHLPHFSRDCSSEILSLILDGAVKEVKLDPNFVKDSLFCEWAYVIDLDKNTFEVYEGFNEEPLTPEDRFYFDGYKSDRNGYYPVKLKKSYSLNALPASNDNFLADFSMSDEDEEETNEEE
jgi:hypothetical protein